MTTVQSRDETVVRYQELFATQEVARNGHAWMHGVRTAGLQRFVELGFPTPDQEAWRYTSFRPLAQTAVVPAWQLPVQSVSYERHLLADADRMVFVDGRLVSAPQVPGLTSLAEAEPALLEPWLTRRTDNPFVALNQAFVRHGAVLHLARGVVLDRPLQLLFVTSKQEQVGVTHPRVLLRLEAQSQATVVETFVGEGAAFTNPVLDVSLGADAKLSHTKLQAESTDTFHVGALRVDAERASHFVSTVVAMGGRLMRQDTVVTLSGPGASCELNGLTLLGGRQHVDHATFIDHAVPRCSSQELYKTMLGDKATGAFTGRILVRTDAQKTDAHQSNKTLLLSKDALMNTRPQLQIHADDVKCTHGAAVGQLDPAALFYLASRGLNPEQARGLLTYAFASDVLERLSVEAVRDALRSTLRERLSLPAEPF